MSKRGAGEGYVYQNARGMWIVRTQEGWLDNGHPKFKTFSGKTRREALDRKKEYDAKRKLLQSEQLDTLKEEMLRWLYAKKKPSLKPSSFDRLRLTVEHDIIPKIGRYSIEEITSDIIQIKIINSMMEEGLSRSTIKKSYDALNSFYKQCIIDRKILYNPVLGVTMPHVRNFDTKKTRALTKAERLRFESAAVKKYANGEPVYRHGHGYIFILYTAIRSGEAMALQYKHIDLENRTVRIEQSFVCVKNDDDSKDSKSYISILQKDTKSESGFRTLPLCDKAYEAIKHHMEINYNGNDEEFVFATKFGKPLSYRNFRRSINAVYKAAEVDASGFHILRHTMASLMLAKKIDIKYISKFLGHSGVQITYDTYVHIIKELEEQAIQELRDL